MSKMTVPQICIKCGNYINVHPFKFNEAHCEHCGFDGGEFLDFYIYCSQLENGLIDNSITLGKVRGAARTELSHGWAPDILAVISAIVLGILTNASYDLIKEWVLSKKEEYGKKYSLFEYEKAVEALLEYLIDNENQIKEFQIKDEEIKIKFSDHLSEIKKEIENMGKNEKSNKT